MSEDKRSCDLCGLPVEIPDFRLQTKNGVKQFCCEGCLGIYRMLHENEIIEEPEESSSQAPDAGS
ncbi:MAG: heavy metal translocating P-type ATPase metal-binding domain-containing protein [Methylohalobius sp. ZOD2]|nr:heavy metal translocating P-type ATPase metal-binding domain-containing protein [Methylothermaceae bacterium]